LDLIEGWDRVWFDRAAFEINAYSKYGETLEYYSTVDLENDDYGEADDEVE
jgi:hypothetical protein